MGVDAPDPRVRRCPGSGQPGQELLSSPCLPVPSPLHLLTTSQQPYQTQGTQYGAHGNSRVLHCPSIHITAINSHVEPSGIQGALDGALDTPGLGGLREVRGPGSGGLEQDWLSLEPCYRDMALSPSPCSSLSSRSCLSEVSSCESFSHVYDDVEVELEEAAGRFTLGSPLTSPLPSPGCGGGAFGVEIWQQQYQHPSPCPSPRHSPCSSVTEESWLIQRPTSRTSSRPTSPCGKRRHAGATDVRARSPSPHYSPSPTPGHSPMSGHSPTPGHSPRGSVTEDSWQGGLLLYGGQELDVPSKTRRTSGSQPGQTAGQRDCGLEDLLPLLDTPGEELGNQEGLSELFLPVPSNFSWSTPAPRGPLFRSSSLPPLDWPLPSRCGPVELKLVSGPRPYHRAHYETEGSRGAIKAVAGGHPVVKLHGYAEQPLVLQVFIATAIEENILRPHAFYQVHRVTGKSVTTACQETLLDGTKVLEIPLLPEQNMSASIDCVGILKLRNADIELRKGETDLGRKNTRVRVVYRVNIPQHHGNVLCLQTASVPIECSQRLALELPQVEGFSPASSSMEGGEEMLIRGHNISTHSRVVFMEKGPEGRTHWEAEAELVTEKSRASVLVVKIPPYRSTKGAVPVHFYVSNGKKKRSQSYSFTYLNAEKQAFLCSEGTGDAPLVKQEGWDLDYISHNPRGLNPSDIQEASYSEVHIYKPCVGPGVYGTYPQTGSSPLHPHTPSYSGQQPCVVMTTAYPSAAALAYNNQSNPPLRCRNLVPDRANMDASAGGFVSESQSRVEVIQATPPSSQAGRGFWPSVPDSSTAPHPHSLFCQGEGPVWVKQEVEESVSLQDFTLDEVNEILDRDFFGLSDAAEPIQTDHNQNSSAAGVTFSSLLH